jgi:hypothetical protein
MEQVAAEESQSHLDKVWLNIIPSITFIPYSLCNESNNKHLNEEDHRTFEEIVFQMFTQVEFYPDLFYQRYEGEAVYTAVDVQLFIFLASPFFSLAAIDTLARWDTWKKSIRFISRSIFIFKNTTIVLSPDDT